jgi:hypothetical protein
MKALASPPPHLVRQKSRFIDFLEKNSPFFGGF